MISRIMIIVYQVNGQTINILSVENISRADQGGMLECRAANNNQSAPASTRLRLLIACKSSQTTRHIISQSPTAIPNLQDTSSFVQQEDLFALIKCLTLIIL